MMKPNFPGLTGCWPRFRPAAADCRRSKSEILPRPPAHASPKWTRLSTSGDPKRPPRGGGTVERYFVGRQRLQASPQPLEFFPLDAGAGAPGVKSWEAVLRRVAACEARLEVLRIPDPTAVMPDFTGLADDLKAAWNAPNVSMRARQRLLRALVTDIIADVDEAAREVVLTIHWRGGQHSQLRVRKPKTGEHGCRTSDEALAVMRSMRPGGRMKTSPRR